MDENKLKKDISDLINQWISTVLRDRLVQGTSNQRPVSLWDRFKQGVTNWWWGKEGEENNKYKWRNRFGNILGMSESFDPSIFTLDEYKNIRGLIESVEYQFNESEKDEEYEKLNLVRILRNAAETLKADLFQVIKKHIELERPASTPPTPDTPPTGRGGRRGRPVPKRMPSTDTTGDVPAAPAPGPAAGRRGRRTPAATGNAPAPVVGRKGRRTPAAVSGTPAAVSGTPAGGVEDRRPPVSDEEAGKGTPAGGGSSKKTPPSNEVSQTEKENQTLKSLLVDSRGRPSWENATKKMGEFVKLLANTSDIDDFSKKELNHWWVGKKEEITKMPDGDKLDQIEALLTQRTFVKEIANLIDKEKDEVLKMLLKFIDEEEHGF